MSRERKKNSPTSDYFKGGLPLWKKTGFWWLIITVLSTAVVMAVAYQVLTSDEQTEEQPTVTESRDSPEPPDTAVQSEEERQVELQDPEVEEVVTTPTTSPLTTAPEPPEPEDGQEPGTEGEPEEAVEDPETGTEDGEPEGESEEPETGTEGEPEEAVEDPETGTEDGETQEPEDGQEPGTEGEPEEAVEDPEVEAEDGEAQEPEDNEVTAPEPVPPSPPWETRYREIEAFSETGNNPEHWREVERMMSDFIGHGCDFDSSQSVCRGQSRADFHALASARACPKGWALVHTYPYRWLMCFHPLHESYRQEFAYHEPSEASTEAVYPDF
ncbi:hypothetical protein F4X86_03075 [Candidatus Saccharibacteria bacterium]|nr:hypothetical protein [Candidatus Saccharibacteria bacterium]